MADPLRGRRPSVVGVRKPSRRSTFHGSDACPVRRSERGNPRCRPSSSRPTARRVHGGGAGFSSHSRSGRVGAHAGRTRSGSLSPDAFAAPCLGLRADDEGLVGSRRLQPAGSRPTPDGRRAEHAPDRRVRLLPRSSGLRHPAHLGCGVAPRPRAPDSGAECRLLIRRRVVQRGADAGGVATARGGASARHRLPFRRRDGRANGNVPRLRGCAARCGAEVTLLRPGRWWCPCRRASTTVHGMACGGRDPRHSRRAVGSGALSQPLHLLA
jgi:hypothetical protein